MAGSAGGRPRVLRERIHGRPAGENNGWVGTQARGPAGTRRATAVNFKLELMWIPVSDVDRAKRFYLEQAGFDLLVDIPNGLPGQRIVQVTPPGSACSIGVGPGFTPSSAQRR